MARVQLNSCGRPCQNNHVEESYSGGNTGSVSSKKVKISLKIDVKKIDFDPQECTIRISGQNREENKYVKIGQYHTLELALHRNFTLHKTCWDTVFLERLDVATDIKQQADLAAVIMQQGQQAMQKFA